MLSDATTTNAAVKLCSRCGEKKPLDDFHRSSRYGRQAWCKPCRKEYDREYHRATRPIRLQQKRTRQRELRAWYLDLKRNKPCADCGKVFLPSAMTWDHLPGSRKITEVSTLVLNRHCSKRVVLAEIAKCELVCANCHAIRSEKRRGVAQPGQSAAFGTRRSPVRIRPPRLEPTE